MPKVFARRRLIILLIVCGLLAVGWLGTWILTQPGIVATFVMGRLESILGGETTFESARWIETGTLEVTGFRLQAPGIEGPAGVVASIDTVEFDLSIEGLILGEVLHQVRIDGATIRLAEDRSNLWQYNMDRLKPPDTGGGSISLPTVLVSGLRIETGLFDPDNGDHWTLVGSSEFEGAAQSDVPGGDYHFELVELMASPDEDPIRLVGAIDGSGGGIELRLTGVALDQELRGFIPAFNIRQAWDEFDLQGSVNVVTATLGGGHPLSIELELDEVSLMLPPALGSEDLWAHYQQGRITPISDNPMLHVHSGTIRIADATLYLDQLDGFMVGETGSSDLVQVPYVINLEVGPFLEDASMGEGDLGTILDRTAFNLKLDTENFRFEQGASVDLPGEVADIFELFGVQECTVNISLRFWRDAMLEASTAQPVEFAGRMNIRDASGAFKRFPYPLHELSAEITFDDEWVHLKDLLATGSGNSHIAMAGVVSSKAHPSVAIKLNATNLPLDASLIDAMPPEARSMMNAIFGRHGGVSRSKGEDPTNEHEHVRLDLDVIRPAGPGQLTSLSGTIGFDRLNLTWDGFPYPITLGKGRLDWAGDRLGIVGPESDGRVALSTAGGGRGWLKGEIVLPETDQAASGNIELVVLADTISPVLLQALDVIAPEESGLLRDLGLTGTIDYAGDFQVQPEGEPGYDMVLKLTDGQARPRDGLARRLGLPGPLWPVGFQLDQVVARLAVKPGDIIIESLDGHDDVTSLSLEGLVRSGPRADLQLSLAVESLPISDRLRVVFPQEEQDRIKSIWRHWQAQGVVSLTVEVTGRDRFSGVVNDLRLRTPGSTMRLSQGSVRFDDEFIGLDGVELRFEDTWVTPIEAGPETREDITPTRLDKPATWFIATEGTLTRDPSKAHEDRIELTTSRANFGNRFLQGIMQETVPEDIGETFGDFDLSGWFAGELQIDAAATPPWTLDLRPESVGLTLEGSRIEATFEEAQVYLDGNSVARGFVRGTSNIGRFDLSGAAHPSAGESAGTDINIQFDFDGLLGAPATRAILPEAVGRTLEELQWRDGTGTKIDGGRIQLVLDDTGEPRSVLVHGAITTHSAAVSLGVEVTDIQASLVGRYQVIDRGTPTLAVSLEVPSLLAADRRIVGISGVMDLSEDGEQLLVRNVRGSIADGAISLEANIAFDPDDPQRPSHADDWTLELLIANADLVRLFGGEPSDDEASVTTQTTSTAEDTVEGRVYLSLFLGGQFGTALSRRGVGRIRITDAVLGGASVIMGIQQLLHLTVPTLSRPDFVDIAYCIDGDQIVLHDILIESSLGEIAVFSMRGEGTYDWANGQIDAVLRPRGGLLIIDDIIGLIQDQLYAIGVVGSIEDPDVKLVPFPGLR